METNTLSHKIFDVATQTSQLLESLEPSKKAVAIQGLTLLLMKQHLTFVEQVATAHIISTKTIENKSIQLTSK